MSKKTPKSKKPAAPAAAQTAAPAAVQTGAAATAPAASHVSAVVDAVADRVRNLADIVTRCRERVALNGLLRDAADARDFCASRLFPRGLQLPLAADLRPGCSPVEDQGPLGSCTAQGGVGVLEFFDRLADGQHVDLSQLALYYFEREAMGTVDQDSGASARECLKQLAIGVPPAALWPYDIARFREAPPAEAVAARAGHRITAYYRVPALRQLYMAKAALARGLPVMCGIRVHESMMSEAVAKTGAVPWPQAFADKILGAHFIVLTGYDDLLDVFRFRNSWGEDWGDGGYGTLPQRFVASPRLTSDMWVATRAETAG